MKIVLTPTGVASSTPLLSLSREDGYDEEVLRNKLMKIFQYAIKLSKKDYSHIDPILLNSLILEDLKHIAETVNGRSRNWMSGFPESRRNDVSLISRNGSVFLNVNGSDILRFSTRAIYSLDRRSLKDMFDEYMERHAPRRRRRNIEPVQRQRRNDEDDFFVPVFWDGDDIEDDIDDEGEIPRDTIDNVDYIRHQILEADDLSGQTNTPYLTLPSDPAGRHVWTKRFMRIFVDRVCTLINFGLRRDANDRQYVDRDTEEYQAVWYFVTRGYRVGLLNQAVDLTNYGRYHCRGGYLFPFYFGFLAGLFTRLNNDDVEFDRVKFIQCSFKMVVSSIGGADREVNVITDIPRPALREGIRGPGRRRPVDMLLNFWLNTPNVDNPNLDPAWRKFLRDVVIGQGLGNVSNYWLGAFTEQLGDGVVRYNPIHTTQLTLGDYFKECRGCDVTITYMRGVGMRGAARNRRIRGVDDRNCFWEETYCSPAMLKKYKNCWPNMVYYKGEHGCLHKAIECVCRPWKSEPCVCNCWKGKEFRDIEIQEIENIVAQHPFMVVGINIKSKTSREKTKEWRSFQVMGMNKEFYLQPQPIVLFLSIPEWPSGMCHCAKWITPAHTLEHYDKFEHVGKFNELIHLLCETEEYICPICGAIVAYSTRKMHYKSHKHLFTCKYCGLFFDNREDFDYHGQYHCKIPRYMARLNLEDELKEYVEKSDKTEIVNVYADLESAIQDDGEHVNILAGWCADNDHRVHIETSLEKMLLGFSKIPAKELRIYFHNGEGYDFHFMIKAFCENVGDKVRNFEIVNDSSEKIRYFTVTYREKKMHFRDTFAFVSVSLAEWVESSKKSGCPFSCFRHNIEPEKQEEILKKNPFPYNAIKSAADLKRPFTDMLAWMDQENAEELFCFKYTKEELKEIKTWLTRIHTGFNWFNIGDYYVDYLKCDVCQLCDVFEYFAKAVKEEYDIDVHQYFGVPGLTWAIWLSRNKFKLDPIMDSKAYDIITSSIRGGQTGAMTRYYDCEEEKDTFVCDLDCNALYATVMMKFSFPCHDWYRCANRDELAKHPENIIETIKKIHAKGESGFIEVDINVKDDEKWYSYVPVASKRKVRGVYEYQAMAEYAALYDEHINQISFDGLTQVVGPHEHYCCHTKLLEWYIEHDVVEVKAFYDMVVGKDEPVFKEYVTHNLNMRKQFSSDPIKKMLYKLLNNALYGKTYEDVTRRSNFQLKKKNKLPDPSKIHRTVEEFGEWVLYEEVNEVCHIEKPVYLGAAITEFSKLWMYRFFYDYIRPKFPKTEVMYTDTDALTIKFTECGFENLRGLADAINTDEDQIIDTSNFSTPMLEKRHLEHNNEPGLFKSETGEGRIIKMVALRAKTYIMICDDGTIKMSVKGCPMKEKTKLTFEMFKKVLLGEIEPYTIEYSALRSEKHRVYNRELERVVLSADDRKRYICDDKIHTYPLFSKYHLQALGKITPPLDVKFP